MRKRLLNPFAMFIIGLCAGILSRLLDIYTQNLGEIFSQMAVWILFGTLISIYSETPKRAAGNTLSCLGQMYVGDERFTQHIDQYGVGTAAFMAAAIEIYTR